MNLTIETLNELGERLFHLGWPMLWQSSLLIAVVFGLDYLLAKKVRAAVRYALWLAVLVKLLLPPALALPTGVAWWLTPAKSVAPPVVRHYTVTYGETLPPPDLELPAVPLPPPPAPKLKLAGWLMLATATVSALLLLWMLRRWRQVTRLVCRAAWTGDDFETLNAACRLVGDPGVRLKIVEGKMSPAVCGLFRPVILLPRELAERLSPAQLRAVLLHELFHLRRGDVWVNCAQALLQIVYWWHPLLWIANARIRRLREEAVDDAVMLALRDEADTYAPTLLEVAKLAFRRPLLSLGLVGIMESRSALRQRIERLVDFRAPRKAGLTLASFFAICMFSAVALPMGEAPVTKQKQAETPVSVSESPAKLAVTFALEHPIPSDEMIEKLLAAGVKSPTVFFYKTNGILFARGTDEQLTRVNRLVLKLNGYSDQEIEAAAAQFPRNADLKHNEGSATNLFSRTFKVNADIFDVELAGLQSLQASNVTVAAKAKSLFAALGVDWEKPQGKSVFFNDKLGKLFVKATSSDLDVVECALESLIQPNDYRLVIQALKQRTGVKSLAGPEVTTRSGRGVNSITLPVISAPLSKTNVSQSVQDGKLLYEMGRFGAAETRLKQALAIEPDNATAQYYLGLIERNQSVFFVGNDARKQIVQKLSAIRLEKVSFAATPLQEVIRQFSEEARQRDPERKGIKFIISPGQSGGTNELAALPITINPAITNLTLGDALDAVLLVAPMPIKYSIQDFGVVFSERQTTNGNALFTRAFKTSPEGFFKNLESKFGYSTNKLETRVQFLKRVFGLIGVDFDSPPGKSIFYSDTHGMLYVKATVADLDKIERTILDLALLPPQIHIKARFVEVPKGTLSGLKKIATVPNQTNGSAGFVGILSGKNFEMTWRNLRVQTGVNELAQPEVTTLSGRQTQMRATKTITIITGSEMTNSQAMDTNTTAIVFQTEQIEFGPILDVVPHVLADDYTIYLHATAFKADFIGYADIPTNAVLQTATNSAGEVVTLPAVWPAMERSSETASVNLYDGQTLVLAGFQSEPVGIGAPDAQREEAVANFIRDGKKKNHADGKELIVFVTATIVDPAGNRVHKDSEMPAAQNGIPPQAVPGFYDDVSPSRRQEF